MEHLSSFISLLEGSSLDDIERFETIDDQVMGGVSSSSFRRAGQQLVEFSGNVSVENNGGFASVRAELDTVDLSNAAGIALKIKGDGKSYKLRLFNEKDRGGIAYEASFVSSNDDTVIVQVPFSSLQPKWRGRLIVDAVPFNPSKLRALGLMISDKQVGEFRLWVNWIRAYR
jgi:monofunctional biosynthetic peptidoglycan transglycosylase